MKRYLILISFCFFSTLELLAQNVWGEHGSRTDYRNDAGLQGNVGAVSGFFQTYSPINYPAGASSWWHLLDVRHSNPNNNYAMQFAGSFWDQNLYFRKTNNNPSQTWSKVLTSDYFQNIILGNDGEITTIKPSVSGGALQLKGNSSNGGFDNRFFRMGWSDNNNVFSPVLNITDNLNVGIGTTNPLVKLDITGKSRISSALGTNDYTNVAQHQGQLRIINGLGSQQTRSMEFALLDNGTALIQSNEAGVGYNTLALNPVAGNVGIGTTSPDEKLTVKGTIHAQEARVDLSVPGPDYVFEKNYKLTSLSEIQKYIAVNKHLPEVPSAKEMEEKGINLSEMNMLLLKKVEELTLHLIKQEERIKKLENSN